jgi:glycosyltransferase involved in cell wall biosynthesis
LDPLISVVIPTYNRAHVLPASLDSALGQTYPRLEIVVVDDGSTDGTEAVVAPYRDRIVYVRQENRGLAEARNTGHAHASGEYVAWLDSDDVWNPEKLALQVAWLQRRPDHVLVASDFSAFDDAGFFEASHLASYYAGVPRRGGLSVLFPKRETLDLRQVAHLGGHAAGEVTVYSGEVYEQLVGGNFLHPPTVLLRREAVLRSGLLDKSYRRDVDYEYFLRVSRLGPVALVDRPLMRYRYSADQMSSDKHLEDIVRSRLIVLEGLKRRDPDLLRSRHFRRRLGASHLAVARTVAESRRSRAVVHWIQSLRWGHLDGNTARAFVKLALPTVIVQGLRHWPSLMTAFVRRFWIAALATQTDFLEVAGLLDATIG